MARLRPADDLGHPGSRQPSKRQGRRQAVARSATGVKFCCRGMGRMRRRVAMARPFRNESASSERQTQWWVRRRHPLSKHLARLSAKWN